MTAEHNARFSSRDVVIPEPGSRRRIPGRNGSTAASCHRRRSGCIEIHNRRGARNHSWLSLHSILLAVVIAVLCCGRGASANNIIVAGELEQWTELVFDRSEPPPKPLRLQARQEASNTATRSSGQQSPTATTSDSRSLSTASSSSQSPLPSPFDSSLGSNFTAPSCPAFFESFLSNDTFNDCTPLSLLLQTSNSFFSAERSLVSLVRTLDASCNVNFAQCSTLMSSLAQQIQLDSNCGADLRMQNPMVMNAYNGLIAYQPLYQAGCLKDSTGNYCFADAVTNASAPTSSYVYYLPLGVQLPTETRPACNTCLQNTMAIFATAAGNQSVPLSDDYASAAQQIDMGCGPSFVQMSVSKTSAATTVYTPGFAGFAMLLVLMALFV